MIGAGYVGAVTAACLADQGHHVSLVELPGPRLDAFQAGRIPFFEPGLDDLFRSSIAARRVHVTSDLEAAVARSSAVLVCVGTPLSSDGEADLAQIESACRALSVADPSTVLVATWLARPSLKDVVSNPEFLAQGTAIRDFRRPSRIVIGTEDGQASPASALVDDLYAGVDAPRIITDFATAEMIKNVSNGFLATKLSFINEVADLCEAYDADIEAVVQGIGLDPRIGASYLRPGIGFGGSCLPKELANLVRLGRTRGLAMPATANDERGTVAADRIEQILGPVEGLRIAFLGLSFKPNTDDTRYSPALSLATELVGRGATLLAHDPAVSFGATESIPGLGRAASVAEAVVDADLVVLATEWDHYRALDWSAIGSSVRSRVLFDGRNVLDARALRRAGWLVLRIGASQATVGREAVDSVLETELV